MKTEQSKKPRRHKKRERLILNCIIPDTWTTAAVAQSLSKRWEASETDWFAGRESLMISVNEKKARYRNGEFAQSQLRYNSYSVLKNPAHIWIHLLSDGAPRTVQLNMEKAMDENRIKFVRAMVRVKRDIPGSRCRKIAFGIVVDIKDATNAILLLRPELLDIRRMAIYNRDEPKY